jgi:type I restriction enzyme S subunit
MSEWTEVRLGDGLRVHHGFAFKGEFFSPEGKQIVLTPGNFIERGGFKPKNGTEKYYLGPVPEKFLLRQGDVVIAMTEQAQGLLGSSATIPEDGTYLHNQRIGLLELLDPELFDLRFVYHLMNSPNVRRQIQATATGSKVRHTAPERILAVTALVPTVTEQQTLAEILDSVDELIENNRRRVAVLEEMARAIYREWFVKFRYPGHEDVPLIDSALGPIPEGWIARPLREVSSVVARGISPKYADEGEWVVLNQKCVRDGRVSFGPSRRQERAVSDAKRIRTGDVLINSTGVGTLGRVAMYRGPSAGVTVDSHVTISRPAEESLNPWYALSILGMQAEIERLGAGATGQTELRKTDVEALELVQPVAAVLDAFSVAVSPLLEQVDVFLTQIEALSALRDLLLPKLVTGQIEVSALDLDSLVAEEVGS